MLAVPGDIADRKTAERAISEGVAAVRAHRHAGQQRRRLSSASLSPSTTVADYAAIVGVNVTGFFHTTQLAITEMEKRGSGHVVQITTSLVEPRQLPAYPPVLASLTKGGLNAATKSLAIEYAKRGIRVNAVAPGCHQDADACRRDAFAQTLGTPAPRWAAWARSRTSWARSSTLEAGRVCDGRGGLHVDGGQSAGH